MKRIIISSVILLAILIHYVLIKIKFTGGNTFLHFNKLKTIPLKKYFERNEEKGMFQNEIYFYDSYKCLLKVKNKKGYPPEEKIEITIFTNNRKAL